MTAPAFVLPCGGVAAQSLRLLRASTEHDLRAAASFRRDLFLGRRGVMLDDLLEARRDREGHVLLLLDADRPVATARVLPFPSRLSSLPDLPIDLRQMGVDSEVGRVAAVRSPEGLRHSATLLALGAAWLLENTTASLLRRPLPPEVAGPLSDGRRRDRRRPRPRSRASRRPPPHRRTL